MTGTVGVLNPYFLTEAEEGRLGLAVTQDFQRTNFADTRAARFFILVRHCPKANQRAGLKMTRLSDACNEVAIMEGGVLAGFDLPDFFTTHPAVHGSRYQFSIPKFAQFVRRDRNRPHAGCRLTREETKGALQFSGNQCTQ